MIIGNDLLLGLSGFLPFLFHRISYRYIKQQPFIGRNTNEFLNLLPSPFTIFVLTFLFYFRILRIFTAITTENTSP